MKLSADYHTHSKHSRFWHGKNTIVEMAFKANELGLKELAITDHSFKHIFRTNKEKLYDARLTIDDLNKLSKTKILLGIEADILDENGTLDVDTETLALIDILIIGYHKMIKTDFAGFFGKQAKTPEAKQKVTNAYLNAIDKYPVSIIAHLDSVLTTDLYQIGKACEEKGTLIEINNRHTNWTQEQMDELLASGCSFVLSSDAHCADDIGNVQNAFELMLKYHIPTEKVMNVEFDYNEKTDEHKELDRLYNEYKRKQNKIETREREEQEQKDFSTIKLSKEMEDALAQIEREQRGGYPLNNNAAFEQTNYVEADTPDETESEELEVTESGTSDEDYAENTDKFLNAINRMSDALSPETQPPQAEGGGQEVKRVNESLVETSVSENQGEGDGATAPETEDTTDGDGATATEVESQAENMIETESQAVNTVVEAESQATNTVEAKKEAVMPRFTGIGRPQPSSNGSLKSGRAEIEMNVRRIKPKESTLSSTGEVKNMFSINSQTERSEPPKVESREISPNIAKHDSKKSKAGAFVDITSLTTEDDGKN